LIGSAMVIALGSVYSGVFSVSRVAILGWLEILIPEHRRAIRCGPSCTRLVKPSTTSFGVCLWTKRTVLKSTAPTRTCATYVSHHILFRPLPADDAPLDRRAADRQDHVQPHSSSSRLSPGSRRKKKARNLLCGGRMLILLDLWRRRGERRIRKRA
jgi:hypothetical protein